MYETFVPFWHADHEETDKRLLLNANHALSDGTRVNIWSPDTDVP